MAITSAFNPALAGVTLEKATTATTALTRTAALQRAAISVDVGEKTVVPTVVRDGQEVQPPPLNQAKVGDLLTRLQPITRLKVPRIMNQSIPPGTRVQKGTPIDVVLLPVSDIDFSLFDNVHDDFKVRSVEQVLPLVDDLKPILAKEKSADLTADEKQTLVTKLGAAGISVDEAVTTRSVDAAFKTLKSAKAFQ